MDQNVRKWWARNYVIEASDVKSWWREQHKGYDNSERLWWQMQLRSADPDLKAWWRMELRSIDGKIIGQIPYDSLSEDMGGYFESLKYGVFSDDLRSKKEIYFLWSHDYSKPLGSTGSGTLKLWDTSIGLNFELIPGRTTAGRDALESIRRGDCKGVSFGFKINKASWKITGKGKVRVIEDAELFELSAVVWPAYKGTTIGTRNLG
jgi:HK97 family phage prohead protease